MCPRTRHLNIKAPDELAVALHGDIAVGVRVREGTFTNHVWIKASALNVNVILLDDAYRFDRHWGSNPKPDGWTWNINQLISISFCFSLLFLTQDQAGRTDIGGRW